MNLDVSLIRKLHRRLHRRHKKTGDRGLHAIGLGPAKSGGAVDASRPKAIIYLVKKKKAAGRVPKKHLIPKIVSVFLVVGKGKNKRRKRFCYPTDVIEIGPEIKLTGLKATTAAGQFFTVSALVKWGQPVIYGALSVGHAVQAGVGSSVNVALPGGGIAPAIVVAFTTGTATLDASLIKFTAPIDTLLPAPGTALPPNPPSNDDLATLASNGADATTCSMFGKFPIVLQVYVPSIQISDGAYNLTDIVMAQGNPKTFRHGASGSVWLKSVDGTPLAIQVAGAPDDQSSQQFIYGFAQPFSEYMDWAQLQDPVHGSLQLISVL